MCWSWIRKLDRDMMSYTKMYNISSFPDEIIRGNNSLSLNWTRPECGFCEEQGKYNKLKVNTSMLETECYDKPKPTRGIFILPHCMIVLQYLMILSSSVNFTS
jgi:hypothetical protein